MLESRSTSSTFVFILQSTAQFPENLVGYSRKHKHVKIQLIHSLTIIFLTALSTVTQNPSKLGCYCNTNTHTLSHTNKLTQGTQEEVLTDCGSSDTATTIQLLTSMESPHRPHGCRVLLELTSFRHNTHYPHFICLIKGQVKGTCQ